MLEVLLNHFRRVIKKINNLLSPSHNSISIDYSWDYHRPANICKSRWNAILEGIEGVCNLINLIFDCVKKLWDTRLYLLNCIYDCIY